MEPENRRKIEETVIDILKSANLEEITEFKVRVAASERLGIDLSRSEYKMFVRRILENFLISSAEAELGVREEMKKIKKEVHDGNGRLICKLSRTRNVVIHGFNGKTMVAIRDFFEKDGKQLPTRKGISLSVEEWSAFSKCVPAIEETIRKMEQKLRSDRGCKQAEDLSNSVANRDCKQAQDFSDSVPNPPHVVHVETCRLNGKNYKDWALQMELLLMQLNIGYVLSDSCPSSKPVPEASTDEITQAKIAEQKWMNDDYLCRRNILNSLSDQLFNLYASKTMSAKELWEELKLVYFYDEFITKRSQVRKYIEFQMVEEKPILEQVHEINNIADSIVAAGMTVEEKFHVSVIISKLPPSWKDVGVKLMNKEYLPFWMLMNRLGIEEELRRQKKPGVPNPSAYHQPGNGAPRMSSPQPNNMQFKKREPEKDGRVPCHTCGKRGHTSQTCRSRRGHKEISEKRNEENRSLAADTEINTVDGGAK